MIYSNIAQDHYYKAYPILSPNLMRDIFLTQKLYQTLFTIKMIDVLESYMKNAINLS